MKLEQLKSELSDSFIIEGVEKKYQNPEGGLNKAGREHYKKKGHNLKPPVSKEQAKKSPKSAARRKSFCARMSGQKKQHNIDCSETPDKRICASLRKWDC
jgi:hypothetical protein